MNYLDNLIEFHTSCNLTFIQKESNNITASE